MKTSKNRKKKVVDPRFAKGPEYKKVIKDIEGKGKCPFCPDNFVYHKHPVIRRDRRWILTKSSWPYENARFHFLIICEDHKKTLPDLTRTNLSPVFRLANWIARKRCIRGGSIAVRFGDTSFTGATVCHLHFHLIVPKLGETVNFPIG